MATASEIFGLMSVLISISVIFFKSRKILYLYILTKALASSFFILSAVFNIKNFAEIQTFPLCVIIGMALSWIGDMFIIVTSKYTFLLALGSFLLTHISYSCGLYSIGVDLKWLNSSIILLLTCDYLFLSYLLPKLKDKSMTIPVIGYVIAISIMDILAIGTTGKTGNWIYAAAATTFSISDICVAKDRLIKFDNLTEICGMLLYYVAQFLFATSISLNN